MASWEEMKRTFQAVSGLCAFWICMALTGCTFPGIVPSDQPHNIHVIYLPTMTPDVVAVNAGNGLKVQQDGEGVCDRAAPGHPIDVTVADGTVYQPEESFIKIWRLVNAGDCAWSEDYAIVYFSGELMGSARIFYLDAPVPPGASVDLSVEMTTPAKNGYYQSNWKLQNAEGTMFGLGPHGDAPFWVRIRVFDGSTPTVELLPTNTPVPMIYKQGEIEIEERVHVDVDSGSVTEGEDADVVLVFEDSQWTISPLGEVKLGLLEEAAGIPPAQQECIQTPLSLDEVVVESLDADVYICYQSSQGLPGYIWLKAMDDEARQPEVMYVTWFVP